MTEAPLHPRIADELDVSEADDGLVVYAEATETVHHLNKTAAVIFGLCDGELDAVAIAGELMRLFGLDEAPLEETQTCLAELARNQLIA